MRNIIAEIPTKEKAFDVKSKLNLTDRESALFDLRLYGKSLEECAEEMHLSDATIKRVNKFLINKILSL